ncbi:peptidyl-prolyl cis-trans isomerase FKBP17-1, chloroplastic isoform X2 [Momordica charantia]|uniref:peptidylprolyl isomerase n=1 Tax=Momordica charantia TaxID=3673 RepID=A0A6J1CLF7_MOMCH|nr:peptidyl-prolyl cis-trans isomerase FKBP17-1, chloroplastic isoform X2 [Momordica charantia]
MTIRSMASIRCRCVPLNPTLDFVSLGSHHRLLPAISTPTRRVLSLSVISTALSTLASSSSLAVPSISAAPEFFELPDSGGVKALELRAGSGETPVDGDQVAVHYYGRLAAKQGWRFDTSYDHKDENGEPLPFTFVLGSGKVIAGMEAAVRTMKAGGIRRVIIPPSQGYQNTSQEPIPPNYFDRQRLFTTIFNPTRLANGEGSSLGILIFDIEMLQERTLRSVLLNSKWAINHTCMYLDMKTTSLFILLVSGIH